MDAETQKAAVSTERERPFTRGRSREGGLTGLPLPAIETPRVEEWLFADSSVARHHSEISRTGLDGTYDWLNSADGFFE